MLFRSAFIHTENFILVDNNQRIRGVYNGTLPFEIKRLIEDIYFLKQSLKKKESIEIDSFFLRIVFEKFKT